MGNKLFVGNLTFSALEMDLTDLFSSCGTVVSSKIILDRETKKSRGFGFVEMEDETQAALAIEKLNGRELGGRALRISEATERKRRGGFVKDQGYHANFQHGSKEKSYREHQTNYGNR